MVYGIQFYDIDNRNGMKADRCCCDPNDGYMGELFNLLVTIDKPWSVALSQERTSLYTDTQKMVDQEVRFLLGNMEYSEIAATDLLANVTFVNFEKTDGGKIGVNFRVHLKRPHWNNSDIIEQSFMDAADEYRNRTDEDVLGKEVLGAFAKNDYVTDEAKFGVIATR